APAPHHSLKGYVAVGQAVAADPKAFRSTPAAAGYLGVVIHGDSQHRPVIEAVERDSPADDAGLKAGDLIMKLDKAPITTDAEARDQLRATPAGEPVVLNVTREAKPPALTAVLNPTTQPKNVGPRAVMGINVIDTSPKGTGAKVDAVSDDMPAAKAGMK